MSNPKHYIRTESIEAATDALTHNRGAYPLAGGALALGTLNFPHETVVDVGRIPELLAVQVTAGGVRVGGAVMLQALVTHADVPVAFKRALTRTLPRNIRANTSVMESLTVERIPTEWLAALAACDVSLERVSASGETSQSTLSASSLVAGPRHGQDLRQGLLAAITLPTLGDRAALGAAYIARTPAGDPILNVATYVTLNAGGTVGSAFAGLCGVSEGAVVEMLALGDLCGQRLSPENIAAMAAQIPHVVSPPDNYLGSAGYRKQMSEVLLRRSLADAAAQLKT